MFEMALTSKITKFDPAWRSAFNLEAMRLRPVLESFLEDIHHVGSTAVPGLAAKPEIDILVVVGKDAKGIDWSSQLRTLGYQRGSDLSDGHQFYKREVNGVRTHKIHVCVSGHCEINRMLMFKDLLIRDASMRREYEMLKIQLEQNNQFGIAEYLTKKAPFINSSLVAK